MKRLLLGVLVVGSLAAVAAGCGNSIDAASNPTPTPDPEVTPQTGTYAVDADVPLQSCFSPNDGGDVGLTFNVPTVVITIDGGDFTPDWNFVENANFSVPDPENGTITASGDFEVHYTYCDYSLGADKTTKHIATWTGSFNAEGTGFDSVLHQALYNALGNLTSTCGATATTGSVTGDMGACSSSGVSWDIEGDIQ